MRQSGNRSAADGLVMMDHRYPIGAEPDIQLKQLGAFSCCATERLERVLPKSDRRPAMGHNGRLTRAQGQPMPLQGAASLSALSAVSFSWRAPSSGLSFFNSTWVTTSVATRLRT